MAVKTLNIIFIIFICSSGLVMPLEGCAQSSSDVFSRFDRNENGVIDPDEFPGETSRFAELDRNRDGVLSRAELRSDNPPLAVNDKRGERTQNGMGGKPGGGFERDDANGDGKVTREEFSGPADMFAKLDKNSDGVITEDEVQGESGGPHQGGPPGRPGM